MLRYAIVSLVLASPAAAEVCDRSTFSLNDAVEGGPMQEARINFTFESGVVTYADGGRETVYCVRNDEDAPIWVKWHGPKPNLLFEDVILGGGKRSAHASKRFEATTSDDRRLEYGLSKNYGKETQGRTVTFGSLLRLGKPILVQATPLDLVGRSLPEAFANADTLEQYLAAYRNSPSGGNELSIWSYATNWLPADSEILSRMSQGREIEGYDGPSFQVSYGLRSVINIDNQTVTSSAFFWFGDFTENADAFALADSSGVRAGLSVVTSPGEFPGLADFNVASSYSLAKSGASLRQDVSEAKVGGGSTLKAVPWTVGLAFEGNLISATQADLFEN